MALSGVLTAFFSGYFSKLGLMSMEAAVVVGMAIAFAASAAAGIFNGLLRVRFGIPTFIVTLAMMKALYGFAGMITKSFPITTLPLWFN